MGASSISIPVFSDVIWLLLDCNLKVAAGGGAASVRPVYRAVYRVFVFFGGGMPVDKTLDKSMTTLYDTYARTHTHIYTHPAHTTYARNLRECARSAGFLE